MMVTAFFLWDTPPSKGFTTTNNRLPILLYRLLKMDILHTIIKHLQQFMPFQKMSIENMTLLAKNIDINYFSEGEVVLGVDQTNTPEHFFIVKQGIIESQREIKDNQFFKNAFEFEEGEGFPFGPLISRSPNISEFIAISDCFVYQIPARIFYQLHANCPVFKHYCETRIALLLEESKRIIQSQYATSHTENQPLSLPLSDLIRKEPYSCSPDTPVKDVLAIMDSTGIGSMVVVNPQKQPLGIFTLHDVLRRISIPQAPIDAPISEYMTARPFCLSQSNLAYEAALVMAKHRFRHILITDELNNALIGVLSEKDLFSLQRVGLRQLSHHIQEANTVADLQACIEQIKQLTKNMMAQGVSIGQLTHLISTLNDLITTQVIALCHGNHPNLDHIDYAWMAMGSEGRLEQMFYTDQDNGIIFADGPHLEEHRQHLLRFAKEVNHTLDTLGFPLCKGGIMAMNPAWCLSASEWQARFEKWVTTPEPQAILNSTIFFDFRPIAGSTTLAEELRRWLSSYVPTQKIFLRFLTQAALNNRPPLGLIRDFSTNTHGAIDLKINGSAMLVDIARIIALASGIPSTNTVQRFQEAGKSFNMSDKKINGCVESFLFIQLLRMRQHFDLYKAGLPLSNEVKPNDLNALNTRVLREAFRIIRELQNSLSHHYQL